MKLNLLLIVLLVLFSLVLANVEERNNDCEKTEENMETYSQENIDEKKGEQASNDPLHGNVNYGLEADGEEEDIQSDLFDTDS
eukprot:gene12379-6046_t